MNTLTPTNFIPTSYSLRSRKLVLGPAIFPSTSRVLRRSVIALVLIGFSLAAQAQTNNTAYGNGALDGPGLTGSYDTAVGAYALTNDTSGGDNSALGAYALYTNTTGGSNTACGYQALARNTTGYSNTATGADALSYTTGSDNTASGRFALGYNTTGTQNTAVGSDALVGPNSGSTGSYNTATGFQSLFAIRDGEYNVANGWQALYSNTSGISNSATGAIALHQNTTGSYNTATGTNALRQNVSGSSNTASGIQALYSNNGQNNTASGAFALQNNTSGSSNVALGFQAGLNLTTGSNNIVIGAGLFGAAGEANTTRIGKTTQKKTFIGGIYGKTVANGVGVIINSTGQLGTIQSSARFKDNVQPMDKASEAILALKPVTFRYKEELDPDCIPQFGLIAEQVEKVNPDLVVRDEDGKAMTVRYEAVNAMLLNEFLKEHRKVQSLEATVACQQKEFQAKIAQQQKQIEGLSAGLQKVNNKIELEKSVPRLTTNN